MRVPIITYKDLLAQSVGLTILEIDNACVRLTSVSRYVLKLIVSALDDWRMKCLYAFYDVSDESVLFFLATKPWRLIPLQHHKMNIDVYTEGFLMNTKNNTGVVRSILNVLTGNAPASLAGSMERLRQLSSDPSLATLIQSLTIETEIVYFDQLYHTLQLLPNIKRLAVMLHISTSVNQVCRTLNQILRLRHVRLQVGQMPLDHRPQATMLFHKLRYASILMPKLETAISLTDVEFAYKSLEIKYQYNSVCAQKQWSEFSRRCTCLAHLTITCDYRYHAVSELHIPPSVVFLGLDRAFLPKIKMQRGTRSIILKRLELKHMRLNWAHMTAYYSHISYLQLIDVHLRGRGAITGLPLKELRLIRMRNWEHKGIVRKMCIDTLRLSHLSITQYKRDIQVHDEFKEWISDPAFLSGCKVSILFAFSGKTHECVSDNIKRVVLFCRKVIARGII